MKDQDTLVEQLLYTLSDCIIVVSDWSIRAS